MSRDSFAWRALARQRLVWLLALSFAQLHCGLLASHYLSHTDTYQQDQPLTEADATMDCDGAPCAGAPIVSTDPVFARGWGLLGSLVDLGVGITLLKIPANTAVHVGGGVTVGVASVELLVMLLSEDLAVREWHLASPAKVTWHGQTVPMCDEDVRRRFIRSSDLPPAPPLSVPKMIEAHGNVCPPRATPRTTGN